MAIRLQPCIISSTSLLSSTPPPPTTPPPHPQTHPPPPQGHARYREHLSTTARPQHHKSKPNTKTAVPPKTRGEGKEGGGVLNAQKICGDVFPHDSLLLIVVLSPYYEGKGRSGKLPTGDAGGSSQVLGRNAFQQQRGRNAFQQQRGKHACPINRDDSGIPKHPQEVCVCTTVIPPPTG